MKRTGLWWKMKLPLFILAAFLIAAAWVGVGRLVFGVFGWMAFITLFMFAPIIVLYGIVLTIIVAVRQQKYPYRKWGPFIISLTVLLVSLFCVGFFMPDVGDTEESYRSALGVILFNPNNAAINGVSGAISGFAVVVTVVTSIVTFVCAFVERPKKLTPTQ